MSLELPRDITNRPFVRAGLLVLDGALFEGGSKINLSELVKEIQFVVFNTVRGGSYTQSEWQRIRNAVLVWGFSHRTNRDAFALNTLLDHVGLHRFRLPGATPSQILEAIESEHDKSPQHPHPPSHWTNSKPPTQRLPVSAKPTTGKRPETRASSNSDGRLPSLQVTPTPLTRSSVIDDISSSSKNSSDLPKPPRPDPLHSALNTSLPLICRYDFSEHRQEYEGYQFQCIFRCLKDNKHCRKAPVREMNRHLRDRHHFRPGFKITGVDWKHKVWRGAGAGHEECVGKIVAKDAPDDDSDGDGDGAGEMDWM